MRTAIREASFPHAAAEDAPTSYSKSDRGRFMRRPLSALGTGTLVSDGRLIEMMARSIDPDASVLACRWSVLRFEPVRRTQRLSGRAFAIRVWHQTHVFANPTRSEQADAAGH